MPYKQKANRNFVKFSQYLKILETSIIFKYTGTCLYHMHYYNTINYHEKKSRIQRILWTYWTIVRNELFSESKTFGKVEYC